MVLSVLGSIDLFDFMWIRGFFFFFLSILFTDVSKVTQIVPGR